MKGPSIFFTFTLILYRVHANSTLFARRGDDVTLSCPSPTRQWLKLQNDNTNIVLNDGLRINPALPYAARLTATNDTTRDSIDIHIQSVADIDVVVYTCTFTVNNTNWNIQFSLYVEPDSPVILNTVQGGSYIEGTEGQQLSLTCQSYNGNPPADVTWKTGTTDLASNKNTVTYQFKPIKTSHLQTYICVSNSAALGSPLHTSVQLILNLRPLSPVVIISSVKEKDDIVAQCTSTGSRPAAILSWFLDSVLQPPTGQLQTTHDTATQTYNVSLQYRKASSRSDNTKNLVCRANNTVVPGGITGQQQLRVWFGPDSVTISGGSTLNENTVLSLMCNAALSNPQSTLTWYKNGSPFTVSSPVSTQNGDHGGKTTHQTYSTTVRRQDNGANITCVSTSTARSAVNSVILNVRYKPTVQIQPSTLTVVEYTTNVMFSCVVTDGNPRMSSSYFWRKGGNQIGTGQTYTIHTVNRSHAGTYSCTGTNVAGTSDQAISTLVVLSGAIITDLTIRGGSLHTEGTDISITCTVDSYPPSTVVWSSTNTRPTFTQQANPNSTLLLPKVLCSDTANYTCSAFNGYGGHSEKTTTIFVKCRPRLFSSDNAIEKVGVVKDENLTISSTYMAYPEPTISWYFTPIASSTSYLIVQLDVERIGPNIFRSELLRELKNENDFGEYKSVARNNEGIGTVNQTFIVSENRLPSEATGLTVRCHTSTSANISWIPGFDGGLPQWFNIMHKSFTTDIYSSSLNISHMSTYQRMSFIMTKLGVGEQYSFKVKSSNKLGSVLSPDEISCKTDDYKDGLKSDWFHGGSFGVGICVAVVVGVLLALTVFTLRKRGVRESIGSKRISADIVAGNSTDPRFGEIENKEVKGENTDPTRIYDEIKKTRTTDLTTLESQNDTQGNEDMNIDSTRGVYEEIKRDTNQESTYTQLDRQGREVIEYSNTVV